VPGHVVKDPHTLEFRHSSTLSRSFHVVHLKSALAELDADLDPGGSSGDKSEDALVASGSGLGHLQGHEDGELLREEVALGEEGSGRETVSLDFRLKPEGVNSSRLVVDYFDARWQTIAVWNEILQQRQRLQLYKKYCIV